MVEITDEVKKGLKSVEQQSGLEYDFLENKYIALYEEYSKDSSWQDDEGNVKEAQLRDWVSLRMASLFTTRQKIKTRSFVVVGMDQVRKTQQKVLSTSVFIIDRTDRKLKRVTFNEKAIRFVKDLQLFHRYDDVPLAKQDNTSYLADERTTFDVTPKDTEIGSSPERVIKETSAKIVSVGDVQNSDDRRLAKEILSRVKSTYADKTDWRAIHGMISNVRHGSNEEEGTDWGSFTILDNTVDMKKETLDAEGNVIPLGIKCYSSPFAVNGLPDGSMVWALGPLSKSKQGIISMNAYCVIPTYKAH